MVHEKGVGFDVLGGVGELDITKKSGAVGLLIVKAGSGPKSNPITPKQHFLWECSALGCAVDLNVMAVKGVIGRFENDAAEEGAVVGRNGVNKGVGVDDLLFIVFEAYTVGTNDGVVEEMVGTVCIDADTVGAEANVAQEFTNGLAVDGDSQTYAGGVDVDAFLCADCGSGTQK